MTSLVSTNIYLVRYGAVPEVARFTNESDESPSRGATVVVETDRGWQTGTVLERLNPHLDPAKDSQTDFKLIRVATENDQETAQRLSRECEQSFPQWCARISQWDLNLELVDLEWTLDRKKLILYVLCERGPDSTKLALQAAAGGFGIVEVQPVSATGLVNIAQSSCGTGEGGCGCKH
jgi:cell fate regulator YaaT (PSP1 superfamily)